MPLMNRYGNPDALRRAVQDYLRVMRGLQTDRSMDPSVAHRLA